MSTAAVACEPPPTEREADAEQRFVLHGVSWDNYVALREMFDERPGLRLTYDRGTLEFMSPSPAHEDIKKCIARLLETFALARRVRLHGFGSATHKKRAAEKGLEPDECYFIGEIDCEFPHLAIEVALSRCGLSKLPIYQALGVKEVWIWQDGGLVVHAISPDGYVTRKGSGLIAEIDLDELAEYVRRADQPSAVAAFFERWSRPGA